MLLNDFVLLLAVTKSCPTLWDPVVYSTTVFPVHCLLEFALTHVHWIGDVIQPSLSLSSPFPPAFSLSQHQSFPVNQFLPSGSQSIGDSVSASVLPMNTRDWSPLGWTGWISLRSKGLSRVLSNTTVQKHQFFGAQPSLWSDSHIHTWPLEKPQPWLYGTLSTTWCLCFWIHCLGWS